MKMKHLVTVCLLLVLGSIPCFSDSFYTDRNGFLSAVGATTTNIDFEGLAALGTNADYSTASGLTVDGVNFVAKSDTCVVGPFPPGNATCNTSFSLIVNNSSNNEWGSGAYLVLPPAVPLPVGRGGGTEEDSTLTITLPKNVFAFGSDAMSDEFLGSTGILTLADGSRLSFSLGSMFDKLTPPPTRHFFGVISDTEITSATLVTGAVQGAGQGFLDNFVFETKAVPTPEPSTLVLLMFGGPVLALLKRRVRP
jgi:hypothetical protein